jgi:hypothetical protein
MASERRPEAEGDLSNPVWLIDEPTPFAPCSEWIDYRATLGVIVAKHGMTPELEEMIREADAALNAKAAGSAEF